MSKAKLKYIKYTRKELNKYVNDKSSCINKINSDLHIGFPPYGFANFRETLTNIISRDKVGKYDAKLNGIILDVSNIKVFGTSYAVRDDDPNNHININADFYVFQPNVGATIKGVVKHISQGHVAVIIYRVFNVSIRFKKALKQMLRINQQISFKIKQFDLQDALPYIEGELIEDESSASAVKRRIKFEDDDDLGNVNDSGISTEESVVKREKNKNGANSRHTKNHESSSSDNSSSSSDDSESDGEFDISKVKIKEEKFTDDESFSNKSEPKASTSKAAFNLLRKDIKKPPDSSETSSSSSEEDEPKMKLNLKKEKDTSSSSSEYEKPKTKINVKKEKDASSSSSAYDEPKTKITVKKEKDASSSSSEYDEPKTKINVKKEKDASSASSKDSEPVWKIPQSSQKTNGFPKKAIKAEPLSDVESISSKRKGQKRKRELSFSEQLDSLYADTVDKVERMDAEVEEKLRKNRNSVKIKEEPRVKKKKTDLSQSISSDLSFALNSPALSSTLKPNAKTNTKQLQENSDNGTKSPKKEKNEQKKKEKNKKKNELKAVEDELFSRFLK